jgi:hypothetical protein
VPKSRCTISSRHWRRRIGPYQAEVPEDLAKAVADVGKQQNLPLDYVERIPAERLQPPLRGGGGARLSDAARLSIGAAPELGVKRRAIHAAFAAATSGSGLVAAYQGLRLHRAQRINDAIASVAPPSKRDAAEARFARALALAESGDAGAALEIYKALIQSGRADLKRAALYNVGNLHLREAMKSGPRRGGSVAAADRAREAELSRSAADRPGRLGRALQPGTRAAASPGDRRAGGERAAGTAATRVQHRAGKDRAAMRASALAAGAFDKHSRAITLALALLLAAWAMPTFNRSRATYDYLVVFDITQSMNVADYELGEAPASRLAYAREATRRALRDLPCGSRVGLGRLRRIPHPAPARADRGLRPLQRPCSHRSTGSTAACAGARRARFGRACFGRSARRRKRAACRT